jgi:hypothetical protein
VAKRFFIEKSKQVVLVGILATTPTQREKNNLALLMGRSAKHQTPFVLRAEVATTNQQPTTNADTKTHPPAKSTGCC